MQKVSAVAIKTFDEARWWVLKRVGGRKLVLNSLMNFSALERCQGSSGR
jgi:hypothetical protein